MWLLFKRPSWLLWRMDWKGANAELGKHEGTQGRWSQLGLREWNLHSRGGGLEICQMLVDLTLR